MIYNGLFPDNDESVDYALEKETNKDHVATPRWVVEDIYNLIDIRKYKMVWLPFNNYDSEFKLKADELRLQYTATHIFDDLRNDFFTTLPPKNCDLLISNPPFGLQNEIIKKTFSLVEAGLVESFCLLLPLSTLETPTRGEVWENFNGRLSIIIFKKRIKFIGKKTSFNTACCWICYNIESLKSSQLYWI